MIHKNLGPIVFENYNSTSLALRVTNYGEYGKCINRILQSYKQGTTRIYDKNMVNMLRVSQIMVRV